MEYDVSTWTERTESFLALTNRAAIASISCRKPRFDEASYLLQRALAVVTMPIPSSASPLHHAMSQSWKSVVLNNLGCMCWHLGNHSQAVAFFTRAAALTPQRLIIAVRARINATIASLALGRLGLAFSHAVGGLKLISNWEGKSGERKKECQVADDDVCTESTMSWALTCKIQCLYFLGEVDHRRGRYSEGTEWHKQAQAAASQRLHSEHPIMVMLRQNSIQCERKLRRMLLRQRRQAHEQDLEGLKGSFGATPGRIERRPQTALPNRSGV